MVSSSGGRLPSDCSYQHKANVPQRRGLQLKPTGEASQLFCSALALFLIDLETFLSDGLKGENLSKKAKEKKEAFIKRIKEV